MIEPADPQELASALADASRRNLRVAVRGGGTKSEWAAHPGDRPPDVVVSTARLDAVLAHRHGDLTATIQAGAVLDDVNRRLAAHNQWLPLDPPWSARATIGGIVSTNDSGPRRHRYGAPRDLIIGVEFARADGTLAKAGGIVVKNVAGYDLSRLVTGAFGALAVVVSATFKLYPIPPESRTVVVDGLTPASTAAVLAALMSSHLTPSAVEIAAPPARLLIRFESTLASVEKQSRGAEALARSAGARASTIAGSDEAALWSTHTDAVWQSNTVAKVSMLPTALAPTLDWLASHASALDWRLAGRAVLGVCYLGLAGDAAKHGALVSDLRARFPPGQGSVVVLRAPEAVKAAIDPAGSIGGSAAVMRAIKDALDPDGILPSQFPNPGS